MIYHDDCRNILPTLPNESIDFLFTDPPYPNVKREYGFWTEQEWHEMMDQVIDQAQRVLKPSGSAVFILQPNMKRSGQMNLWVWEFLLRTAKKWNLVQDVYWWNYTTLPCGPVNQGLCRPSVKYCLWFGPPDCYRNQSEVLWTLAEASKAHKVEDRALENRPSGHQVCNGRIMETAYRRGGTTPFNLIPLGNGNSVTSSGAMGHGAGTPQKLTSWWIRYCSKPGDMVLDPFAGAGTTLLECQKLDRRYIGIEKDEGYCQVAANRINEIESAIYQNGEVS